VHPDPLSRYREKRSPDRTPEPFGPVAPSGGRLFVVHKHAARHLHYDLRLEMGGVLRSWAVPKGPSYDQKDKRLAVFVEDHPLEYGDFEGLIPEGNYGAGAVIVWDRGEWMPDGDPGEGLAKGKLLFELKGYKLRGRWTLVKIKKGQKEWLLIKERDAWLRKDGGAEFPEESVLSGLTVEDLKAGRTPEGIILEEVQRLKPPRRQVKASAVEPMLAEPREKAFTRPGWIFELKLDGYRMIGEHRAGAGELRSRNGIDYTPKFPEIAKALARLPVKHAVVDGEVAVLDPAGRPSFHLLQQRARLSKPIEIQRAAVELPATYFVFDLLGFDEFDLRPLPLVQRKRLLRRLLPPVGALKYLDHFEARGEELLEQVAGHGLEGIIGKKADSSYKAGRGPAWVKIRAERTGDFVVVGFTPPKGSRDGFGALHLADYVDGELVYAGRAGSGFDARQLKEITERLKAKARPTPACGGPRADGRTGGPAETKADGRTGGPADRQATLWLRDLPDLKGSTWVEPELVAEVKFTEWTDEGLLRHPVFVRFRDDKRVDECIRQGTGTSEHGTNDETGASAELSAGPPVRRTAEGPLVRATAAEPPAVAFSNLKKVFWPAEGYTKGDLIEYYRAVAPWLLPYLKDRPLVLTRFPDGIEGKSFYQKDAPEFAPEWMRTVPIWSEDTQREIRYFVCDTLESLLYIANMGSIPLHLWASRVESLERPDWCVLDLDPKEATFADVVTVARALHQLCEEVELPNFVKTTGKTGLHILLPLGGQCTYEQSRTLGELLARLVIRRLPEITTITRVIHKRGPKVYFDYLQNRRGQTIVAPFSVRPLPGATVSMPLEWKEVNAKLDVTRYTIRTAVPRLTKLKRDPMAPVLDAVPDLGAVLERLAGRLRGR
jgi:bifunctional non-homologous end joining protein LigD